MSIYGSAIAQAVKCWLLTTKPHVQYQQNSREICGDQSGTGVDVSSNFLGIPLLILIPAFLLTYLPQSPGLCYNRDLVTHYQILGFKLRAYIPDPALG